MARNAAVKSNEIKKLQESLISFAYTRPRLKERLEALNREGMVNGTIKTTEMQRRTFPRY